MKPIVILAGVAMAVAGCAQSQQPMLGQQLTSAQQLASALTSPVTTGSVEKPPAASERKRERPVVAGRPARMYVFAGFKEKTCEPVEANLTLTQKPTQGTVEFRKNQTTTITQSASGKCLGTKMTGTGVYYTANDDAFGPDRFAVEAKTDSGPTSTKTFALKIDR